MRRNITPVTSHEELMSAPIMDLQQEMTNKNTYLNGIINISKE